MDLFIYVPRHISVEHIRIVTDYEKRGCNVGAITVESQSGDKVVILQHPTKDEHQHPSYREAVEVLKNRLQKVTQSYQSYK